MEARVADIEKKLKEYADAGKKLLEGEAEPEAEFNSSANSQMAARISALSKHVGFELSEEEAEKPVKKKKKAKVAKGARKGEGARTVKIVRQEETEPEEMSDLDLDASSDEGYF